MTTDNWEAITETRPAQGVAVLTKIDGAGGPRNKQVLVRNGNLWFIQDMSVYVYYTPTHFKEQAMTTTPTSGAADLPEALIYADLPKHAATGLGEEYESFDQNGRPMGKAYQNLVYYTEDQMRAFADATHTLRASRGQAPASVLHLVHSAFAEIAMAFPKAFALHKVGIADTAVREALAAPATAQADSVQEDAALWHWLAEYLVGTRTDLDDEIVASETVNDLRKLVKAAIKQGATQ